MIEEADYIIIGAGSSGCVLAAELSRDPGVKVLVLESGPTDQNAMVSMPRGLGKIMVQGNPRIWGYDAGRGGSRPTEFWLKGRVLGGSSSVNGMIYTRGFPVDYDRWAAMGCKGWSWADMLPHFIAIEDNEFGASPTRGSGGPLHITTHPTRSPLCDAILAAAEETGTPRVVDVNSAPDGGLGYAMRTIWKGRRQSAALAFLRPAMSRPNLSVEMETSVLRLLFEGKRAVGVELQQKEQVQRVRARCEVILCAGAIQSPKLLELSGIGSGKHLQSLGISVVSDLPGVGENLSEHLYMAPAFRVSQGSYNADFSGLRLLKNVLRYFLYHDGPMSHSAQEMIGYIRSNPALPHPDCQIGIGLYSLQVTEQGPQIDKEPGITIGGYFMHPQSRGQTHIASRDPKASPQINVNYLAEKVDADSSVALLRFIRNLAAQPALKPFIVGEIGPFVTAQSDLDILDAIMEKGQTAYHVSGTCRMGADEGSVVDPQLRVRGIERLRIADTSIFPDLVSGNTNAPAMAAAMNLTKMMRETDTVR